MLDESAAMWIRIYTIHSRVHTHLGCDELELQGAVPDGSADAPTPSVDNGNTGTSGLGALLRTPEVTVSSSVRAPSEETNANGTMNERTNSSGMVQQLMGDRLYSGAPLFI